MDLPKAYLAKSEEIKNRLNEFGKVKKKEDIFYELCFCLLTPQSNGIKCWEAVEELKKIDFLNKDSNIAPILQKKTRFHNHKTEYLKNAKQKFNEISGKIQSLNKEKLRFYLFENVKGLGLKEVSHLMRNIGYKDLAILDRHILKNLCSLGVINEIPKTLTKKNYFEIEEKFKDFGKKINISMDELDLYFWSLETGKVFK